MTDQPTDHPAQAAEWLGNAAEEDDVREAIANALIGIGHQLGVPDQRGPADGRRPGRHADHPDHRLARDRAPGQHAAAKRERGLMGDQWNLVEDARRTGWLDMLTGGDPFGIETVCVWCGCIVRREFKAVHRLTCATEPAEPTTATDYEPCPYVPPDGGGQSDTCIRCGDPKGDHR